MTLGILVASFVIFAHRSNIGRILRGEEYRFGSGRAANAQASDPPAPNMMDGIGPERAKSEDGR
jgi:hypothetical protein